MYGSEYNKRTENKFGPYTGKYFDAIPIQRAGYHKLNTLPIHSCASFPVFNCFIYQLLLKILTPVGLLMVILTRITILIRQFFLLILWVDSHISNH